MINQKQNDPDLVELPRNANFGWIVVEIDGLKPSIHNIPTYDFRMHTKDGNCWCKPEKDPEADLDGVDFYLHNSLDKREFYFDYHTDGSLLLS